MRIRHLPSVLLVACSALVIGACGGGDDGVSPRDSADDTVIRFTRIADSLDRAGDREGAGVFRGAAEVVRTVGAIATFTLTVDGRQQRFDGIALRSKTPAVERCINFGDQRNCYTDGPYDQQLLLGWSGSRLDRLFVIAADAPGATNFEIALDETSESSTDLGDVAFFIDREGIPLFSISGSGRSDALGTRGACPASSMSLPGVAYSCVRGDYRVSADLRMIPLTFDEPASGSTAIRVVLPPTNFPGAFIDVQSLPSGGGGGLTGPFGPRGAVSRAAASLAR